MTYYHAAEIKFQNYKLKTGSRMNNHSEHYLVYATRPVPNGGIVSCAESRAAVDPSVFTITEKASTRAFAQLKVPNFTFTDHGVNIHLA